MLLLSPHLIETVAERIGRAYGLRYGPGPWEGPDPRLWGVVARALVEAHRSTPWLPLDPELFVACQPAGAPIDPWAQLEPIQAVRRYARRVRRLALGLRRELAREVRRAEDRMAAGRSLEEVIECRSRHLSPLSRFVLAHRHGRPELAEPYRRAAHGQHAGCPLYRLACRGLLPASAYPVVELLPGLVTTPRRGGATGDASTN